MNEKSRINNISKEILIIKKDVISQLIEFLTNSQYFFESYYNENITQEKINEMNFKQIETEYDIIEEMVIRNEIILNQERKISHIIQGLKNIEDNIFGFCKIHINFYKKLEICLFF